MTSPLDYESFVGRHFQKKGFKITTTPTTGDYGVDLFAENKVDKIAIQVKMFGGSSRKVNRKCIMELYGAKDYFDCTKAIMVTNGHVLSDALEVANKLTIEILNLDFVYENIVHKVDLYSFERVWEQYIFPLKNQELIRKDGSKMSYSKLTGVALKGLLLKGE